MLLGAIPAAVAAAVAANTCIEGPPKPVDPRFAKELRPTQTAQCPYGLNELLERITKLSVDPNDVDSVETVEKAFGVPAMTMPYDDPRSADYMTILSGKDGWKLIVEVKEAVPPFNQGPARFVPGPHPKRLGSVADAKLSINLTVIGPPPISLGSVQCVPALPLFNALSKAGWKDVTYEFPPETDNGGPTPEFRHGNKSVGFDTNKCIGGIFLHQDAVKR